MTGGPYPHDRLVYTTAVVASYYASKTPFHFLSYYLYAFGGVNESTGSVSN